MVIGSSLAADGRGFSNAAITGGLQWPIDYVIPLACAARLLTWWKGGIQGIYEGTNA